MPIYEYECSCCGARFEQRRSFTEDGGALCPRCQGHAHRLLSAVPVIFKGSGFYVTDYPKSGQSNLESTKAAKPSGNGSEASKTPAATGKAASPASSSKET